MASTRYIHVPLDNVPIPIIYPRKLESHLTKEEYVDRIGRLNATFLRAAAEHAKPKGKTWWFITIAVVVILTGTSGAIYGRRWMGYIALVALAIVLVVAVCEASISLRQAKATIDDTIKALNDLDAPRGVRWSVINGDAVFNRNRAVECYIHLELSMPVMRFPASPEPVVVHIGDTKRFTPPSLPYQDDAEFVGGKRLTHDFSSLQV